MSFRAKEVAKWRSKSQQPYRADVELSEFREWIGFRLYLRPETDKLPPEMLGETIDDCLVEFICSMLLSLEAAETTTEHCRRTIGKVREGMFEDPDLKAYAVTLMRSERLPLASVTYLDLAERRALYGGKPAPSTDEGSRFARVFLAPVMIVSLWETDMNQAIYIRLRADSWWRYPSSKDLLTLIQDSPENAAAWDILMLICWDADERGQKHLLPRCILHWFLGASFGRPKRPIPKPAPRKRPSKIGYKHRNNEVRNTIRLLEAGGMPEEVGKKAVANAFPYDISLRTVRRIYGEAVTVSYTRPAGSNFIRDTQGNSAGSFSGETATNNAGSTNSLERSSQQDVQENSAATGAPTINGTAQVGESLIASTSDISDADGVANASFTYQWLADDTAISGATGGTYTLTDADAGKIVKVTVSFTDDAGNAETLTSAATAAVAKRPLTATTHDEPSSHDGSAAFTFELRLSENIDGFSYTTLQEHALTVTGGTLPKVRRLEPGRNVRWEITVQPSSNADVTIVLAITTDCTVQGAICTSDGRKLSGRVEVTISGPGG